MSRRRGRRETGEAAVLVAIVVAVVVAEATVIIVPKTVN